MKIAILRRDGTSHQMDNVKHLLWFDDMVKIYRGEHGADRSVEFWPMGVIDHIRMPEDDAYI